MKRLINIWVLFSLVTSCNSELGQSPQINSRFDTLPLPKDSTVLYFNSKIMGKDTLQRELDSFVNSWYSEMLFALKEPILENYNGNKEIYRFTWLRTFHHPVSIRLEKQGEIFKVFTKVCNGAGGYEPGKLIQNTTISIQQKDYKKLLDKLSNFNFWNIPTEKTEDLGTDGSRWIIEAVKGNRYHFVSSSTPRKGQETFREIGQHLISISKINTTELEDYY